jgi:hypothetical protein
MNGFFKACVLARVTNTADGTTKQGKRWFRANCVVREYNFGQKEYQSVFFNIVAFDRTAEAMIEKQLVKDDTIYAEGKVKIGKPFETNKGETITPWDLEVRNWYPAGKFIFEQIEQKTAEPVTEENPFG